MTEIGSVSRLLRQSSYTSDLLLPLPKLSESKPSLINPRDLFTLSIKNKNTSPKIIQFANKSVVENKFDKIRAQVVQSAKNEWKSGVTENRGSNRGTRVDQYARNASFAPGYQWCGFFAAFNYSKSGFQYPEKLASYPKARDFFLYRDYVNDDKATDKELDSLRKKQKSEGSPRQYFMLKESPGINYIKENQSRFINVDLKNNTFDYKNLPVKAGDTVLFSRGHVGLVESYNKNTGQLVTIEGNASGTGPDGREKSNAVVKNTYDLTNPSVRKEFDGFGRPALSDFKK